MPDLLWPLEEVRRRALRSLLSLGPLRWIFVDPRRRIPAAGVAATITAAALSIGAPLISLWLGAALLGVPHVVSGVRHVAFRAPLSRVSKGCVLLAAPLGIVYAVHDRDWVLQLFGALFALAMAAEVLAPRPPLVRGAALGLLVAAFAALGLVWPLVLLIAVSHLHALSSVAYFSLRAHRRGIAVWPMLALGALVLLAAITGLFDSCLAATPWPPDAVAAALGDEVAGVALPHAGAVGFRRALCVYAFGQAWHYAVWLRLVPEVDRPTRVPQSFRRALASLRSDLGGLTTPALLCCAVAAPIMLAGGALARASYFALVYFHIGLEAAALMRLLATAPGGRPRRVVGAV